MDTSSSVKPSNLLHKTKSLRSLRPIKDPTKCDECRYKLPYHSRSCVSGATKLCQTCGRDKTFKHNQAVCDLAARNMVAWSPDTKVDRHAAALRKQGNLPPTPEVESQPSLKRSNSEEEHYARDAPAACVDDNKDAMDTDDLYIPDTQVQQVDDIDIDETDAEAEAQANARAAECVNFKFSQETSLRFNQIHKLISNPNWRSDMSPLQSPAKAGVHLAKLASHPCLWLQMADMLDKETSLENDALEAANAFHSHF